MISVTVSMAGDAVVLDADVLGRYERALSTRDVAAVAALASPSCAEPGS